VRRVLVLELLRGGGRVRQAPHRHVIEVPYAGLRLQFAFATSAGGHVPNVCRVPVCLVSGVWAVTASCPLGGDESNPRFLKLLIRLLAIRHRSLLSPPGTEEKEA